MGIPKLIHQTLSKKNLLTDQLINNIARLKSINPDYRHHFYTEEDRLNFIKHHYEEKYLKIYNLINPAYGAAKADFFRYLVIYKLGGVYLDIKSTITTPLEKIIKSDDKIILSNWQKKNNNSNWEHIDFGIKHEWQMFYIISEPGHPYLKNVIEIVVNNILNYNPFINKTGKIGVLSTTGPIPFTHGVNADFSKGLHRVIDSASEGIVHSIFQSNHHSRLIGNYRYLTSPVIINKGAADFFYKIYSIPLNLKRAFILKKF